MRIRNTVVAVIVFALVGAACSSGDPSQAGPSTVVPSTVVPPTVSAPTDTTASSQGAAGIGDMALVASDVERVTRPADGDAVAVLVDGGHRFAADLYEALADEASGNLAFSPFSIRLALAMAYAGARGSTATQMSAALGFGAFADGPHAVFNALDQALAERNVEFPAGPDGTERRVELSVANALWAQRDAAFEASFLDILAGEYGAGMHIVDFVAAAEQARLAINEWVADETADRITELIGPNVITELTRLVLTNAVALDASWAMPFDPEMTAPAPFTTFDSGVVDVDMMRATLPAQYAEGDGWQAVELPYVGGELAMLIVLPDTGSFDDVEAAVGDLLGGLEAQPARVALGLPRFEFRSQLGLVDPLKALGVVDAFDPTAADFSAMNGERDLFIGDVVHETYVAVDEAGTEAAAATAVVIDLRAAPIGEPIVFEVDRPFLFALRDQVTGTVLFLGRVVDPTL